MHAFALASASPRRRDLLLAAGLSFELAPQDVDESIHPGEAPIAYVLRVARKKAEAYDGGRTLVLSADTTVALDGEILAKAADDEEAVRFLRRLSGRTHRVHTAVVLRKPGGWVETIVTTDVRFRALSDAEIGRYVATGEPRDKAGAYGIQGFGGALIDAVHGSYTNVIGLPLEETLVMLREAGAGGP
ncbi:MAG: Maf family protein [Myxococcota bacterium]